MHLPVKEARVKVKLIGQWEAAAGILTNLGSKVLKAYKMAALQEGHYLRAKIVEGVRSGAPGGKQLLSLAASTIAVRKRKGRGGTKPLIVSGAMINSVTVLQEGETTFVGILATAKGGGGVGSANKADVHEFGRTFAVPLTPKAKRFLMANFKKGGVAVNGPWLPGGGGSQAGPSGTSTVIITIPARPFVAPVFEAELPGIQKRFVERVAKLLGNQLGYPG